MFNYKADHQFHLQSFSGFLLIFFSTQRGKMGGEKFKQKKKASFLFFASNLSHNKLATQISCACWHTHPIPDTS
jgi:hypothetical protein